MTAIVRRLDYPVADPAAYRSREWIVTNGLGGYASGTVAGPIPAVERIGLDDTWGESAGNAFLLQKHGLSAEGIAARVTQVLPARSGR